MNAGRQIRFYRKQKKMSQAKLANGICSIPYLSKIENGQVDASREIIDLLCQRLDIQVDDTEEVYDHIYRELNDWYKAIFNREETEASAQYTILREKIKNMPLPINLQLLFRVYEFRYFLFKKDNLEAKSILEELHSFTEFFSPEMNFHYHNFKGLYYYLSGNYEKAKRDLLLAEKNSRDIQVESWQKAYLYYLTGLIYSNLREVTMSIDYTSRALKLFDEDYNYSRSAECQIMLGICYLRINQYEKSQTAFERAKKIADSFNNKSLKGIILQNMGYLYSKQRIYTQGIEYYEKSLIYKGDYEIKSKLNTVFSIIENYYKLNDPVNCQKWIEVGNEYNKQGQYKDYEFHFSIYEAMIKPSADNRLEEVLSDAISYFVEQKSWKFAAEYAERLAELLAQKFKYKLANHYYQLAANSYKQTSV